MSGTCSLVSPPGDPWPSCLLPSQLCWHVTLWDGKSWEGCGKASWDDRLKIVAGWTGVSGVGICGTGLGDVVGM